MGLARKNLEKEPDRVPQDPHFFKWAARVHAVLSRRASLRMQLVHAAAIGSGERELQRPRFELRTYYTALERDGQGKKNTKENGSKKD